MNRRRNSEPPLLDLRIRNLTKKWGSRSLFKGLNLVIHPGEFVAILGPSGGGKSTLLKLIAGLIPVDEGEVEYDRSFGSTSFVFQEPRLLPWRTVQENILLPLELLNESIDPKLSRSALSKALSMNESNQNNLKQNPSEEDISNILRQVHLEPEIATQYPHQLSGGMKMRVSLARALVNRPRLLLMDEPFSSVDELTRMTMQEDLRMLYETPKERMILFVTHSIPEAVYLSSRILLLDRQGELFHQMENPLPKERRRSIRQDHSYFSTVNEITRLFEEKILLSQEGR